MSLFGSAPASPLSPALPRGELMGNYPNYETAQETVKRLVDEGIELTALTIVGRDVRVVNRLRRRAGYPQVVLRSAVQGAFFGLLIGLLMSFMAPDTGGLQMLSSMALGIGIWVIFGVIGQAIRRRQPGFETVPQVVAVSYDVVCAFESAPKARGILGHSGAPTPTSPAQQAPDHAQHQQVPDRAQQPPAAPPQTTRQPDRPDQPAQSGEPSQPNLASQSSQPSQEAGQQNIAAPPSSQFRDLPDGRPQFGVRVDDEDSASEPTASDERGGDDAETTDNTEETSGHSDTTRR